MAVDVKSVVCYLAENQLEIRFCHMAVDVKSVVCYLAKRLSIKGHAYRVCSYC